MENTTINCRTVRIVSENTRNVLNFSRLSNIDIGLISLTDRSHFVQNSIIDEAIDALVIDIDSCGLSDTSYLIFLSVCLTPWKPIVLITSEDLDSSIQQRYLSSGATAVIRVTDDSNTTTTPV